MLARDQQQRQLQMGVDQTDSRSGLDSAEYNTILTPSVCFLTRAVFFSSHWRYTDSKRAAFCNTVGGL